MLCMSTYAERLAWAMTVRGLSPHTDQSELARKVGMGCKPQNIQHLLDPNKNAKFSKYSSRIAEVLRIDPQWLSYETGERPAQDKDVDLVLIGGGSTTLVTVKSTPPPLEDVQRDRAQAILASLSGAALTKALAFLQELEGQRQPEEAPPAADLVIESGKPDPTPAGKSKQKSSS